MCCRGQRKRCQEQSLNFVLSSWVEGTPLIEKANLFFETDFTVSRSQMKKLELRESKPICPKLSPKEWKKQVRSQ